VCLSLCAGGLQLALREEAKEWPNDQSKQLAIMILFVCVACQSGPPLGQTVALLHCATLSLLVHCWPAIIGHWRENKRAEGAKSGRLCICLLEVCPMQCSKGQWFGEQVGHFGLLAAEPKTLIDQRRSITRTLRGRAQSAVCSLLRTVQEVSIAGSVQLRLFGVQFAVCSLQIANCNQLALRIGPQRAS